MPLINCKVELKLKWTKYYDLSVAGTENGINNNNANNIIFTIKDTNLYVPLVTLSARDNQNLWKPLNKGFERSVYWNEHKAKSENKNIANTYRYFLESNFVVVLVFIQMKVIMEKTYDQAIDWHKTIWRNQKITLLDVN